MQSESNKKHTYENYNHQFRKDPEKAFPTFVIRKHTDKELGRQLSAMGYEYKKQTKGASYRMKER